MLREDSPCAWRENGRGPVRLSGLRYGVGTHHSATPRSACSGVRENRSSRAIDGATWAYTSVPCGPLGIFAPARLGRPRSHLVRRATALRAHITTAQVVATRLTERTQRGGVSS